MFRVWHIKDGIAPFALTITGGEGNVDVVVMAGKFGVELRTFDILQDQPFHYRSERGVRLSLRVGECRKGQ
jgi:hypothetical protein